MLRMLGNKVELYRFKIEYEEAEQQRTGYCISEEHKNEFISLLGDKEYLLTEIDQAGNEWIEGMEFNSCEAAFKALEMGEEGYKAFVFENDMELITAAYLLDLDSRILMLEWGLL